MRMIHKYFKEATYNKIHILFLSKKNCQLSCKKAVLKKNNTKKSDLEIHTTDSGTVRMQF